MASATPQSAPSIQYAEPVALKLDSNTAQFDAYGRRFSLTLTGNDRVLSKLPAQRKAELKSYRLLRGSLDGTPGSWVRLTEWPGGVEGAIWDGHDLYTVTSYERIAPYLTTPIDAVPGQTVVYRLSDSRDVLPKDFCALAGDAISKATNGLEQYRAVISELDPGLVTTTIARQIEISLIADSDFEAAELADPMAAMLARLNIVEGIFSEQVGLLVIATDVRLIPANADPFTSTKGATLLEQLGNYRAATPDVRARGLAHLLTGKDLDGTTAGIAYVGTVCDATRGVSLSSRSFGTTISALIMAHELGHNFGAVHDGEAGTACAAVGPGFIMAPSVSGFTTFSECSIATMTPVIAAASCITPADYADVTVEPSVGSVTGEGGLPFTLPFTVRSIGNQRAENATVTVSLPANAAFTIDSASSSMGSCSVSGVTATCALGAMDTDASATVSVVARSTIAATFAAQAHVGADNDRVTSNNTRQLSVALRSGIDAGVALSTSAAEVALGSGIEIYADVSSRRALPLHNAVLSLNLNQAVTSATMPGGACTVNASSVTCTIADLPSGTSRRLTVQATTQSPGSMFASASVTAAGDGDFTNNSANTTAWVQADRDVELTAGPATVDLGVGSVYQIPYTVRSRGPLPTGDVTLTIAIPAALLVDSLDAGGVVCTRPDAITWRCELGAIAPGTSRAVNLSVHATAPATADIDASADATGDGYATNNSAGVQLRVDHVVDLAITMASGGSGVEDTPFDGQVSLKSNGRQAVVGAMLDIDLHAAGILRSAAINNGAACTLIDAQHARCALPTMARGALLFVNYRAEFAEPGSYDITFTTATPGDTAPDNDTLTRAMPVRPYNDIAVSGALDMTLVGGDSREKVFTVTVDRRPLAIARFVASHALPGLSVQSISASGGDCRVDADLGGICDFTDLPAFASVPVTVDYLAAAGSAVVNPTVSVSTPGDVVSSNDSVTAHVQIHGETDLDLRVDPAVAGAESVTVAFPLISIVNGADVAVGARLEITLPAQVTLVSVSAANATCSGTAVLRCDFTDIAAGITSTVSLSVRASATGTFMSSLRLTASNDSNPANDSRDVAMEISGAVAAAPNASSGGGGGGSMEWAGLAMLGLLVGRKLRRR